MTDKNPWISIAELDRLCAKHGVNDKGRKLIDTILSEDPIRRPQSGNRNYTFRYASKKMVCTISGESRTVELPFVIKWEHDPKVYVFLDQPHTAKLQYQVNGRNRAHNSVVDFFIISEDFIGFVECKPKETLEKISEERPYIFQKDTEDVWRCEPGEAYAAQFGLGFKVASSGDLNWFLIRNSEFLGDYLVDDCPEPDEAIKEALFKYIKREQGILAELVIDDLENIHTNATSDDLYWLLARQELYFDMFEQAIEDLDRTNIYTDEITARAHYFSRQKTNEDSDQTILFIEPGEWINWDGIRFEIINIGNQFIFLSPEDKEQKSVELSWKDMEDLIKQGKIIAENNSSRLELEKQEWLDNFISEKSLAEKERAIERLERYREVQRGTPRDQIGIPIRTLNYHIHKIKEAIATYGNDFAGCFDNNAKKGNREPKIPDRTKYLMLRHIKDDYLTIKQESAIVSWRKYKIDCEDEGVPYASYQTFCTHVRKKTAFQVAEGRQGEKAADDFAEWHWELTQTLEKHGCRPFNILHVDHTELDILLISKSTGKILGKPWLTLIMCAYSRRILAVYITFNKPSKVSCMMAIREMVRRFNRIGDFVIVDWGSEFNSIQFESLLAKHVTTKMSRPKSRPKFGNVIERLFGTTRTQLIALLAGNTQILKQIRKMSRKVDPANTATWTLQALSVALKHWAYEMYDTTEHPALGQSPREAFNQGMHKFGKRSNRRVIYNQAFLNETLPEVKGRTRKVRPGSGVCVNYIYYYAREFKAGDVEGSNIEVIYDPSNAGIVKAFVKGRWVTCRSQEYARLKGRSWSEIKFITEELGKEKSNSQKSYFNITARDIAYYSAIGETEEKLKALRDKNRENNSVLNTTAADFTHDNNKNLGDENNSQPAPPQENNGPKKLPDGEPEDSTIEIYERIEL